MERKNVLITGANKGIGFETARQLGKMHHQIIITSRDVEKGVESALKLQGMGLHAHYVEMDVRDEASIKEAETEVSKIFGKLDVLINNAAILNDRSFSTNVSKEAVQQHMDTNFYGPLLVSQIFLPMLMKSKDGRIINVSSQMGILNEMGSGAAAYRFSKAAINSLTTVMAADLAHTSIKVNSMYPGWVRTEMGGEGATKTIEEGADTIVWLATTPEIPTGKIFFERKETNW